ncbi:energy transducer TonB [Vitreimonas flagellata]|uniref:energy transducer TonB n=1 Tax=Vitreimonas flagellata TaxID=2560861 RepID=UPI001074EC69|nr:energy transducer TonB [Vitreimonas flagellata]
MVRFAFLAVMAALSLTPPSANAQSLASWAEQQPTLAQVYATYPTRALSEGVEGHVHLLCTVRDDRTLDCAIHNETPLEYGFGAAALRLSALYIASADDPRVAVGNRVTLPIAYRMAD